MLAANAGPYSKLREPYPAWANENIPLSKEEIEDVFIDLANKVGFNDCRCAGQLAARMGRAVVIEAACKRFPHLDADIGWSKPSLNRVALAESLCEVPRMPLRPGISGDCGGFFPSL